MPHSIKSRSISVILWSLVGHVLSLRPIGDQSRGMCSKHKPTHGIESASHDFVNFGIVIERPHSLYF